MKKIIKSQIIIAFLLSLNISVLAQTPDTHPWCPPGATWVYGVVCQYCREYITFTYEKDEVFQGQNCKKISAVTSIYTSSGNKVKSNKADYNYYFYNKNDSVFMYYNNTFNLIYNFSPSLLFEYAIAPNTDNCLGYPFTNVHDSVNTTYSEPGVWKLEKEINIDANNVRYKAYNYLSIKGSWSVGGLIIKNIGGAKAPIPYVTFYHIPYDFSCTPLYSGLLCYYDSLRGQVSFFNQSPRDFDCLGAVGNQATLDTDNRSVYLYPNPAISEITVKGIVAEKLIPYIILNVQGKEIKRGDFFAGQAIAINELPKGSYVITIPTFKVNLKFVKL